MDSMKNCRECGSVLKSDEIAIYLKLVTRNAKDFLCIDCLGKKLKCGREPIEERIKYYRESGNCTLFR
ncbi:MAG TPA: hypothetical protein VHQ24_11085 [Lachnospiraceae bacterium]|nr:hypothetical protein [Lachnospiraceae bacterium]